MPVMLIHQVQPKDHVFHSAQASNADGDIFNLNGEYTTLLVTVAGAGGWNGTATFQASQDGANFTSIRGKRVDTGAVATTATGTTALVFAFNVAGVKQFKIPTSGRTTGTVTITGTAVVGPVETKDVQLSGSNVEQTNGADIATKSALVAGKTSTGKGVPIQVDADGKVQVGGITVESLTATTVGIDQTTPGTTNKVVAELSGSIVSIGGVSFAVSGGDTLRNTAANKPNADAAHAAIPFCYYYAVDTGVVEVTDGTNWVVI